MQTDETFDVMVHLLGEQRLPAYLGMRQFECHRHFVVHSGVHGEMQDALEALLPSHTETSGIGIEAYDPHGVHAAITKALKPFAGARIGFNLTGGTKLMYAGAAAACKDVDGTPLYFDPVHNEIIWLGERFRRTETATIETVRPFFELAGFRIKEEGCWGDDPAREARAELTKSLWPLASKLSRIYRKTADYVNEPGKAFSVKAGNTLVSLDHERTATVEIGTFRKTRKNWPDFARYIAGGWFEEFCYLCLRPALDHGTIYDLRIGLTIDWRRPIEDRHHLGAQEFDLSFTDGHALYLLECKAGTVKAEHVYGLENHVRHYGGVVAKGALVAAFPPPAASTRRRIEESLNVGAFYRGAVLKQLAREVVRFKPGQTFGGGPRQENRVTSSTKKPGGPARKRKEHGRPAKRTGLGSLRDAFEEAGS